MGGRCRACWKAPERVRIVGSQPREDSPRTPGVRGLNLTVLEMSQAEGHPWGSDIAHRRSCQSPRVRPPSTTRAHTVAKNTRWLEQRRAGGGEHTPELRGLLRSSAQGTEAAESMSILVSIPGSSDSPADTITRSQGHHHCLPGMPTVTICASRAHAITITIAVPKAHTVTSSWSWELRGSYCHNSCDPKYTSHTVTSHSPGSTPCITTTLSRSTHTVVLSQSWSREHIWFHCHNHCPWSTHNPMSQSQVSRSPGSAYS